jgi:Zn-dependent protease
MQRYTRRDIVVLALIAALFIWYFGRSRFRTWEEGVIFIAALIVAVTFHEFAHAFIALRLGDATAKMLGRVSLNPIRHLDLFGSMAFLFIGFGWGKPVPINPYNMRGVGPLTGDFLATIAGPVSNVLLAFLATIPFRLDLVPTSTSSNYLVAFLITLVDVNISLAAFNFLPIPPLDGFSIARLVLPRHISAFLEQYGMFVLIALIFLPQFIDPRLDILRSVLRPLVQFLESLVLYGL